MSIIVSGVSIAQNNLINSTNDSINENYILEERIHGPESDKPTEDEDESILDVRVEFNLDNGSRTDSPPDPPSVYVERNGEIIADEEDGPPFTLEDGVEYTVHADHEYGSAEQMVTLDGDTEITLTIDGDEQDEEPTDGEPEEEEGEEEDPEEDEDTRTVWVINAPREDADEDICSTRTISEDTELDPSFGTEEDCLEAFEQYGHHFWMAPSEEIFWAPEDDMCVAWWVTDEEDPNLDRKITDEQPEPSWSTRDECLAAIDNLDEEEPSDEEEPPAEQPSDEEEPPAEQPPAEQPSDEKEPDEEEPPVEQPSNEEEPSDEEEPPAEQPPAEQPSNEEEPPAEQPPTEQPSDEEEPDEEEPPAEQPSDEDHQIPLPEEDKIGSSATA